jgi:hypothetical protein
MNTSADFGETDPLAPRGDEVVSPPRWIGCVVGLSSGIFAVAVGMVVGGLGNSRSSLDLVGSSFIDRTPRWLKELAIQTFGTNDKIALEVGMIGVLIIVSGVLGLLSRKRLAPLQGGIVAFGILGALSALEHAGAGFFSIIAPLCGVVAGLFAANRLHGYLSTQRMLSRTPQQSRVPLGWDRRRFIRTVGALGALSGGGVLFARSREQARVQQIQDLTKVPLPPLHEPVAGVVVTCSDAVELLQIVMGVRGVKLAGVETVTVAWSTAELQGPLPSGSLVVQVSVTGLPTSLAAGV